MSFVPILVTQAAYRNPHKLDTQLTAVVKINGEVVDHFPLNEGLEITETYYPNPGQYNIIEIADNQARIKEDNSPDQIGVRTGWISQPGQTAICLPHSLMIEIQGHFIENDDLILPLS